MHHIDVTVDENCLSTYLEYKITKEREEISTIPKTRVKFFGYN